MLSEGVVDVAVLREAAKLVIGRPGARAVQISAGNKDLEDDQENCGGEQCPDLFETRLRYGSKPVNCHLSYWSEWSACTTVCGVSGKQTIYRHRIRTEQCGGVCTSTFYETRACPLTSCLNGGRNKILPSSQKWPLRDLFFFFLVIVQKTEVKDSASDVNVTHISYCGLA